MQQLQYPIFLVGKDGITDSVKHRIADIKPIRIYIIGGQAVVGTAVEEQVSKLTPLGKEAIARLNGADRYETSLAVANYFKLWGQTISVAIGKNFPDALSGSVYAENSNAPIILVDVNLSKKIISQGPVGRVEQGSPAGLFLCRKTSKTTFHDEKHTLHAEGN